jgi:hypothetical protein
VRPHVRVIPLIMVFVLGVCAVTLIPVDLNERRCRETPDAEECKEPESVPWFVRLMVDGY